MKKIQYLESGVAGMANRAANVQSSVCGRGTLRSSMMTLMLLVLCSPAFGVILEINHTFDANAQGWVARDPGEMTVSWNNTEGNPAPGSLQGTFGGDVFTPETDAFRLNSIPNGGDLTANGTPLSFAFQFYADNIVPSDAIFRFGNNSFTFFRGITVPAIDSWYSYTLSLTSLAGWFGGDQTAFNSVLMNTTFIELQITRSGFDAQTYYFDSFTLSVDDTTPFDPDNTDPGGGGGGPSAVPEPNTVNLLAAVAIATLAMRRFRMSKSPAEEKNNADAIG